MDFFRVNWWLFGEPRRELRSALDGLARYIVTAETAKHRWFRFLDAEVLPDNKLVVVASDSAAVLGVLSSSAHAVWFAAHCGKIGMYEGDAVYVKGACFDAFPFPDLTAPIDAEIEALAEELHEVRDVAIARSEELTLTSLYNVRDRWRAGESLVPAERRVFEAGSVGIIDHLHGRIDRCVERAYGWEDRPSAEAVLHRLRALNAARAVEEGRGQVRHLRPSFQRDRRAFAPPVQTGADLRRPPVVITGRVSPERLASVVLKVLRSQDGPVRSGALLGRIGSVSGRGMRARVADTLAILSVAGTVRKTEGGWFAPRRPD